MLGHFTENSVQSQNTEYHPKLLKSDTEISFFNDVLNDLKILDDQKNIVTEHVPSEVHISIKF